MFEVYGTPGVDVYISPSMERGRERADTRRWHFDTGLEIIVVMNSPSNDLNDSHVSRSPGLGWVGQRSSTARASTLSLPRWQGSTMGKYTPQNQAALQLPDISRVSVGASYQPSGPRFPLMSTGDDHSAFPPLLVWGGT